MTRLFHFSDPHFGFEDRAALDWVAGLIRAEAPHGVLITGDLTMRARRREFAAARAWIGALGVPVRLDPGNHDLPYVNMVERLVDPYRRFRALESDLGAPLITPGLALIRLRTTARGQWRLNWSRGHVAGAALMHTLAQIDALPPGTPALITCHHPLVEVGTRGRALTAGGDGALAQLARRNVLAVLSGHVHDGFDVLHDTPDGPVRMIGAGTLSHRLRATPPSCNELTVTDGRLECTLREMPGVDPATFGRYR